MFYVQVLSGLIHCKFIPESRLPNLIREFKQSFTNSGVSVAVKHGAVLGLCSFISAFPHEVPGFLPNLLIHLGSLLNQKQPVSGNIICELLLV